MKIIKINTLNPYRDAGKPFEGASIDISLPSSIVSFEKSFGDSTFVGQTFKMADGTYGTIYANLLFESQLVFNTALLSFYNDTKDTVPGFTEEFKSYFDVLTGDKEVPQALYSSSREKTLNSLIDFLNNDDSVFEYYLSQPFQDTASVGSLKKYWQNNVNSELTETFNKGNQLSYFSKLENEYAIYKIAEGVDYVKVDNKFSGNYNTVFYCGGVLNESFATETAAIEKTIEVVGKCQQEQCVRFKSMNYNSNLADANVDAKKDALAEAVDAIAIATSNLDTAKQNVEAAEVQVTEAQQKYNDCISTVPPCPDLAQATQDLANAQANLASAKAAAKDAENALAAAEKNAEEAADALNEAEQAGELANNNCGE